MTYSNLTRPLWSWLATDAPDVNFFGSPQAGPNRIGAEDFLATHQDLAAGFSWGVRQNNMNALNTHDTARAATVMIDGGPAVGAVLAFCLPGVPVMFAGDEFGLEGFNGEDSRTPMPWDAPDLVRNDLRSAYATLGRLRKELPALTGGGVRWLHAQGDALVFIREFSGSSALVFAARSDASVIVDSSVLSEAQLQALGAAPRHHSGKVTSSQAGPSGVDGVWLRAEGPSAGVWALPGTAVPGR